jgi:hypothetical protein
MLEGVPPPPPHTQDLMVPALRLSDGSSPKFIAKWFQPQPHNQMVPQLHTQAHLVRTPQMRTIGPDSSGTIRRTRLFLSHAGCSLVPDQHFGPDGSLYLEPCGSTPLPPIEAMVPATLS